MKRTDPQSIRQIIDTVINRANNRAEVMEHKAAFLWADIVGPSINAMTSRRYVKAGVLHVYLNSGPLKNELAFSKSAIVAAINEALGEEILTDLAIH